MLQQVVMMEPVFFRGVPTLLHATITWRQVVMMGLAHIQDARIQVPVIIIAQRLVMMEVVTTHV
jgi:hypothetical protein